MLVLVDLHAAFDKTDQATLMNKLMERVGVTWFEWLTSCFSKWKFFFVYLKKKVRMTYGASLKFSAFMF